MARKKIDGLSMVRLMSVQRSSTKAKARSCVGTIKQINLYNPVGDNIEIYKGYRGLLRDNAGSRRVHECRVVGISKPRLPVTTRGQNVHVTCGCEDFKFVGEWALHYHGISTIKHSNGEPPVIKNPSLFPHICKHIYAVMLKIIQHESRLRERNML